MLRASLSWVPATCPCRGSCLQRAAQKKTANLVLITLDGARNEEIYQNQIAATLCRFLDLDYREQNPGAGEPIAHLFTR